MRDASTHPEKHAIRELPDRVARVVFEPEAVRANGSGDAANSKREGNCKVFFACRKWVQVASGWVAPNEFLVIERNQAFGVRVLQPKICAIQRESQDIEYDVDGIVENRCGQTQQQ